MVFVDSKDYLLDDHLHDLHHTDHIPDIVVEKLGLSIVDECYA